jgi:hypothetical protein
MYTCILLVFPFPADFSYFIGYEPRTLHFSDQASRPGPSLNTSLGASIMCLLYTSLLRIVRQEWRMNPVSLDDPFRSY